MKARFSTRAFATATLTYLVLTFFIGAFQKQAGAAAELAGHFRQTMFWLDISTWIWTPVPKLITYIFPTLDMYYPLFILGWSLCIGIFFGLLAPRVRWLRRHFI
jgi:hypothetical protein